MLKSRLSRPGWSQHQTAIADTSIYLLFTVGTARRAMLINSCYVSGDTGVRQVSDSKRDLQGHSRALGFDNDAIR